MNIMEFVLVTHTWLLCRESREKTRIRNKRIYRMRMKPASQPNINSHI